MNVWTKAFFLRAVEAALVAGASSFTGIVAATGTPSIHSIIAGAVGFGLGFLYSFIKEYGIVQAVKSGIVGVVSQTGKHVAP